MRSIGLVGLLLLAGTGSAGCAALDVRASPAGTTATVAAPTSTSGSVSPAAMAKVAQAQRTHEYPGPVARQSATSGAARPMVVIQAFATAYINWTAASVSATMRALEQLSVGQARSEVALAAAQTAQDYELGRDGIVNAGVVEAIAPVLGHRDEYAVITRELTSATNTTAYQGLGPAWHLALATVTRLRAGQWVVSAWQPES